MGKRSQIAQQLDDASITLLLLAEQRYHTARAISLDLQDLRSVGCIVEQLVMVIVLELVVACRSFIGFACSSVATGAQRTGY